MGNEDFPTSPVIKPDDIEPDNIESEQTMADVQENSELIEEVKLDFVDKNYKKIGEIAGKIMEQTGIDIDFESIDKGVLMDTFREVSITMGKMDMEILKIGSFLDKRIAVASIFLIPLYENAIEIEKRQLEGEKFSYAEKWKEIAKIVLPKNKEDDYENIDKAGELLDNLGNTLKGKKAIVVKIFAKLLKNGEFQKGISKKFREWLEDNKSEGKSEEESIREILEEKLGE